MGGVPEQISNLFRMPKIKTSQCRQIDIRELKRSGMLEMLELDEWLQWHWREFVSPVTATLVDQGITISHIDRDGSEIEYLIPLLRTACHMSGTRPWFGCPVCGRRVAILYSILASKFACRTCFKLAYPSQSESAENRAHRSANNIRRRLGWKVGTANPEGDKPKGMHWTTFDKLRTRYAVSAQAAFMDTARRLGMIPRLAGHRYRRKAKPANRLFR